MEPARLAAIEFFGGLADADLAAVANVASEVNAAAGDKLTTEGEFGYALYAIETGTAEVTRGDGHIASLRPGDVFGEIGVLAAGRRTATVTATAPMRLIALFKRDVWALEEQAPAVAQRLRALIAERRSQ